MSKIMFISSVTLIKSSDQAVFAFTKTRTVSKPNRRGDSHRPLKSFSY